MPDPKRPNFLIIVSDEHAPQTMGCMGADFARTPVLDRLAARGTTFDNAYCNFSLCVPSRSSFMSGLLCHRIEAWDIGSPLASNIPTWAHMLRAQGYRTIMDGKMHFIGPDNLHGFQEHWHEGIHKVSGFRRGEETGNGTGHGCWSRVRVEDDDTFTTGDLPKRDDAVRFLDTHPAEQPFCLCVGFGFPHYPLHCSRSAFDLYNDVEIPPPVPRESLFGRNVHWSDTVWGFDRFTPEQTRQSRQAYLAMVTMLDGWIGQVLEALERGGHAENTVILYTSDHGDMWGEHGLWGKNLFYEESARVPLIVSGPQLGVREGARVDTPVSLLDLFPTLRDAAGVEGWNIPQDGRSLWAACTQGAALPDIPIFCDYYACDTQGPERMVRYRQHKLNYYHRQGMELFDLETDPRETRNVIDDPAYATVKERLLAMAFADWDPDAIDAAVLRDQNRRTLIGDALQSSQAVGQPRTPSRTAAKA